MNKLNDFTKEAFSLLEKRVSMLIIGFAFFSIISAYLLLSGRAKDLPPNLLTLLISLITAITSVNVLDYLKRRSDEQ